MRAHGYELGEVFEELDESGARSDRPRLEKALARIESGESQGLCVAKIDRLSRSLSQGLARIEQIADAGAIFASVDEGIDLSTETGRLVLRMMLSLGEWELERIRAGFNMAGARAIARGVHVGTVPFGYRPKEGGRLAVVPAQGALVSELFLRRANGASLGELCEWMNDQDIKSPRGADWKRATVRHILSNRTNLGEVRHGEFSKSDAHAALTDEATWTAAQRPVQRLPMRDRSEPALLRGILRCAGCQRQLTTSTTKGHSRRHGRSLGRERIRDPDGYVTCDYGRSYGKEAADQIEGHGQWLSVREDVLLPLVEDFFAQRIFGPMRIEKARQAAARPAALGEASRQGEPEAPA